MGERHSASSPRRPRLAGAQENQGKLRGQGTGTETGVPPAELSRPAPWGWVAPGQRQPELIRDKHHTRTCAQPQRGLWFDRWASLHLSALGEKSEKGPRVGCLIAPPGWPRPGARSLSGWASPASSHPPLLVVWFGLTVSTTAQS